MRGSSRETIGFVHQAPAHGTTVVVEMQEFRFIPNQITVERGHITFEVRNKGDLPHVFQVTGLTVERHIALLPGGSATLEVSLTTPGMYTLIGPIPLHPEEGMPGRLVMR